MSIKKVLKVAGIAGIGIAGLAAASAAFGYGICMRLVNAGVIGVEQDEDEDGAVHVFIGMSREHQAEHDTPAGCEHCMSQDAVRDCGSCSRNKCVDCMCEESCEACPFPAGICACHQADGAAVIAEQPDDDGLPEIEYDNPDERDDGGVPVAEHDETEFVCDKVQCNGCTGCGVAVDLAEEQAECDSMPETDFEHQPDDMVEDMSDSQGWFI